MYYKIIIFFLFFLLRFSEIFSQKTVNSNLNTYNSVDYKVELEKLYQKCTQTPLDSIRPYQVAFLRKYQVFADSNHFYAFCRDFKQKVQKDNKKELFRRTFLTETIDKLKYQKANTAKAEKTFGRLYDDFLDEKDYSAALEALFELAQYHHYNRDNVQAMKVLFFAEKFAQKHNENYQLTKGISYHLILYRMGYILWDFDLPKLSIKYLQKSLETTKTRYLDSLITLNALGINHEKINDLQTAMAYFDKATQVCKARKNDKFGAVVAGNMAVVLYKLEAQDKAFLYAQQDKNMSFQEGWWENAVGALYWLVRIELKRNNFEHAKILLDSLDNVMPKTKDNHFVSQKRQKEATYLYYQTTKNYEKALDFYKEFTHFEKLFDEKVSKNRISELQLSVDARIYEDEMNEKEEQKQIINILFVSVVVALIVLLTLVFRYFHKKNLKIQQEKEILEEEKKEVENVNIEQAQEIEKLKIALFEKIEAIKQSNIAFANILKNENILKNIEEYPNENQEEDEENNEDIEDNFEGNLEEKLSELEQQTETEQKLQVLRNFNLTRKDQWKEFKGAFLSIYPDFDNKFSNEIGILSDAELRLIMLHKLKLSSKEIAEMLLISPNSVRKAKYRLYQKIGINSAEELDKLL